MTSLQFFITTFQLSIISEKKSKGSRITNAWIWIISDLPNGMKRIIEGWKVVLTSIPKTMPRWSNLNLIISSSIVERCALYCAFWYYYWNRHFLFFDGLVIFWFISMNLKLVEGLFWSSTLSIGVSNDQTVNIDRWSPLISDKRKAFSSRFWFIHLINSTTTEKNNIFMQNYNITIIRRAKRTWITSTAYETVTHSKEDPNDVMKLCDFIQNLNRKCSNDRDRVRLNQLNGQILAPHNITTTCIPSES